MVQIAKKINDGNYAVQSVSATNAQVGALLSKRDDIKQVRLTLADGTVKRYKRAD